MLHFFKLTTLSMILVACGTSTVDPDDTDTDADAAADGTVDVTYDTEHTETEFFGTLTLFSTRKLLFDTDEIVIASLWVGW